MNTILLVGAAYNIYGGIMLLLDVIRRERRTARADHSGFANQRVAADYLQLRIFVFNTAIMFGAMYVLLYFYPSYILPFLIFGTAHKYATFSASLVAKIRRQLPQRSFWIFGVGNLILAIAFTVLLLSQ